MQTDAQEAPVLLLDPFLAVFLLGRDKRLGCIFLRFVTRQDDGSREGIRRWIGAANANEGKRMQRQEASFGFAKGGSHLTRKCSYRRRRAT